MTLRFLPPSIARKEYAASDIVTAGNESVCARPARVFNRFRSGHKPVRLEAGVAFVDQSRALNVGLPRANMHEHRRGLRALGYNAWVSTFCPFLNWQYCVVAVGQQERMESIADPEGWLSEGHGIDLTFLATGPDFETRTQRRHPHWGQRRYQLCSMAWGN